MAIVGYGSVLYAAVLAPLLSPALVVISLDFDVAVADITVISGYMLLVTGGVGPLVSACARKWGKRPMLLIASIFGLLGTVIGSAVYSYNGLLAGRIIQGGSMYVRFQFQQYWNYTDTDTVAARHSNLLLFQ
jgi:MFS family permease